MVDNPVLLNVSNEPQCQYFVLRKKRLCRMTVKPGRQYCGEHEPQPKTADGEDDTRVPCPNDPKHTCYVSKLEKHLTICNARPREQPPYIVHNINSPADLTEYHRRPLSQLSKEEIKRVIDKINIMYDTHIKGTITAEAEHPIHSAVVEEFSECDRAESSLRHLRQASSLLWLVEGEGLVNDNTCYVELGAGKGQLSYYACKSWCSEGTGSMTLLVDRASLRHKRDNKLRAGGGTMRLRTDLAHLYIDNVPHVTSRDNIVGLAKHLCGVATDYALRCVTSSSISNGLVLATCCHHRCVQTQYVANTHLQEHGITGDDINVMLGVVSWATCGDGRSRDRRDAAGAEPEVGTTLPRAEREEAGRRAKCVLDWGRVMYLRERGFDARLCYYVPTSVSLENICIVAKKRS